MLFLFDYGDCWEFEIECMDGHEFAENNTTVLPCILKIVGEAPKQYPDEEDEEDYDDEDEDE